MNAMPPSCISQIKPSARLLPCLLAIAVIAASGIAAAAPTQFTWTNAVSGDWSDATMWTNDETSGTAPIATGLAAYSVEFSQTGIFNANQDLNAGFLLNRLVFGGSEVTLTGNGIQFVTNGAALPVIEQNSEVEISAGTPLSLAADLTFGGTGSGLVTLSGGVSGSGGLIVSGLGTLSLTGANTYSGSTTVTSGTLHVSQANTGNDKSVVSVAAGATLDLDFTGSDTVASLVIGEDVKPDGLYDSTNSNGAITGTGGILVVTPLPSSNASLASLSVSGAGLSPAFNPLTGNYSTSVGNAVSSVTMTPSVAGEGATVTVNGTAVTSGTASAPIALNIGPNLITTLVRAQDAVTTRTYTVNVNRASAAVVSTAPAVVIDSSRATLNGNVNPNGVSTVYFEYGTSTDYGIRTPDRDVSGNTTRTFAASLTGLNGATTYHFRAVLFNAAGTIYGSPLQFTTPPNPPVAATGAPSNVTSSTATFIGAVNPNGVRASVYFEYGRRPPTASPRRCTFHGFHDRLRAGAERRPDPGAAYHYRLVASNTAGTALGNDVLFTVTEGGGAGNGIPTAAPDVTTNSAVGIGTETAILQGAVNPNSGTTLVQFDYGLSTAYGKTTVLQGVGNGSIPADVALAVQGALPGTTYHYRLTGSNSLGKSFGEDAEFTTDFLSADCGHGCFDGAYHDERPDLRFGPRARRDRRCLDRLRHGRCHV